MNKTKEKQPTGSGINYIQLTAELMEKLDKHKQKVVYQFAKSIKG